MQGRVRRAQSFACRFSLRFTPLHAGALHASLVFLLEFFLKKNIFKEETNPGFSRAFPLKSQ